MWALNPAQTRRLFVSGSRHQPTRISYDFMVCCKIWVFLFHCSRDVPSPGWQPLQPDRLYPFSPKENRRPRLDWKRGLWAVESREFGRGTGCSCTACFCERPVALLNALTNAASRGVTSSNLQVYQSTVIPASQPIIVFRHSGLVVSRCNSKGAHATVTCYHALKGGVAQDGSFALPELQAGESFMVMIGKTCHTAQVARVPHFFQINNQVENKSLPSLWFWIRGQKVISKIIDSLSPPVELMIRIFQKPFIYQDYPPVNQHGWLENHHFFGEIHLHSWWLMWPFTQKMRESLWLDFWWAFS